MGSVTISIEIEFAWGHHDTKDYSNLSKNRTRETQALKNILDICDDNEIPLSFGVVGHLLNNSCDGDHNGPYPRCWFNSDPGTDAYRDPLFYAPDVVELIEDAKVDHEVCTHTFSHTPFGQLSEEIVKWDLERGLETHDEYNSCRPTSLIPPRNFVPPLELIKEMDITSVRVPNRIPASSTVDKYLNRIKEWTVYKGHPVYHPDTLEGVVLAYSTRYPSLTAVHLPNGQSPPLPIFKRIPERWRRIVHFKYLRQGVRKAIKQNANAHFWTHLQNMSNKHQMDVIEKFFRWLGHQDTSKQITIKRLRDL